MVNQAEFDAKLADYFRHLDPLAVSILAEIDQIKDKTQNWSQLSEKEREKIIDKNFVPRDVRKQYAEANSGRKWEGVHPHRLIETGQAFHGPEQSVRDEFSDPFHWETQSQCETFYVTQPIKNPMKMATVKSTLERVTPRQSPISPQSSRKSNQNKPPPPPRSASRAAKKNGESSDKAPLLTPKPKRSEPIKSPEPDEPITETEDQNQNTEYGFLLDW